MELNIICANNNCYNCNNNIECNKYKDGLIKATEFFNNLIFLKKYKITLELDPKLVLSNEQVKRISTNRKYWWIKNDDDFINIDKIEANIKFKMDLELTNGSYTIGCGTIKNGIRKHFYVLKDDYIFIK